jgi:hypothetical protein
LGLGIEFGLGLSLGIEFGFEFRFGFEFGFEFGFGFAYNSFLSSILSSCQIFIYMCKQKKTDFDALYYQVLNRLSLVLGNMKH